MTFRFYGSLNDFLPPERRQVPFVVHFSGVRSVKDAIESLGVPHPELELILLNGVPVGFAAAAHDDDRVAAFPKFYRMDVSGISAAATPAAGPIQFVLDGHLGKLARRLRLVGVDAACPPGADDETLADIARREERILLTRDAGLLKRRSVTRGYFVREIDAQRQLAEVLERYGPVHTAPFTRCLRCNGILEDAQKSEVEERLPPRTRAHYEHFQICRDCGQVYWRGSHWRRLQRVVDAALQPPR